MNAQSNTNARLAVPAVGGAILFTTVCSIVAFFAGVAAFNLMHSAALSTLEIGGSVLWLIIVAIWLTSALVEAGGIRELTVSIVGIFARRAFVEIQRQRRGPPLFRYGFEWFGKGFYHPPIEITRIGMVTWNAGQASGRSGRDCDDWTVAVWYDRDERAAAWDRGNLRDKRLRVVTPWLPRQDADAIGRSVVALLRDAGVPLISTGKESALAGEFMVDRARDPVP